MFFKKKLKTNPIQRSVQQVQAKRVSKKKKQYEPDSYYQIALNHLARRKQLDMSNLWMEGLHKQAKSIFLKIFKTLNKSQTKALKSALIEDASHVEAGLLKMVFDRALNGLAFEVPQHEIVNALLNSLAKFCQDKKAKREFAELSTIYALKCPKYFVRLRTLLFLEEYAGRDAMPVFEKAMQDPSTFVRGQLVNIFEELGRFDLIKKMHDSDPDLAIQRITEEALKTRNTSRKKGVFKGK